MAQTPAPSAENSNQPPRVIPPGIIGSFILVTFLFSLWGFANDITNPMVAAFKNILLISNFQSSLVQFAFYGGYCVMAIPAALFIKRFSYKSGILLGLILYATGCLLFIPAGWMMAFWAFLLSYFIMTCGLSFLETSANPYILSMGPEETSTQRLNFAQSFNPMGSITGMLIASQVILVSLNPTTETGRRHLEELAAGTTHHAQIYDDSLASIETANGLLTKIETGKLNQRNLTKLSDALSQTQNRLSCLSPERGPKAVELRTDLYAAEKNAPKLLAALANRFTKKQDIIDAQKALKKQNQVLKDSFYNDKSAMDLTIQTNEENKFLADIAPDVFAKIVPQEALALVKIQNSKAILDSAIEAIENGQSPDAINFSTDAIIIKDDLSQASDLVTETKTTLETIPAQNLNEWSAAASTHLESIRKDDLGVIVGPYAILGFVVLGVIIVFVIAKLPKVEGEDDNAINFFPTLIRLIKNRKYLEGVVAQAFYVGAQIMCWTFIIQYGVNELGLEKATAANYNILAMAIFVSSRFICTFLLKFFSPGGLLMTLAIGGGGLILGVIFVQGMVGLYCLIGVSACMSLMFPTIYGIALKGLGDDAKLGAAGLIMAIGGGCFMTPMQGAIMDLSAFDFGFMTLSSIRVSFFLPFICFVVIAIYGFRTSNVHKHIN